MNQSKEVKCIVWIKQPRCLIITQKAEPSMKVKCITWEDVKMNTNTFSHCGLTKKQQLHYIKFCKMGNACAMDYNLYFKITSMN